MTSPEITAPKLPTEEEIQELYRLLNLTNTYQQQTPLVTQDGFHYFPKYSPLKEVPFTTSAHMGG